MFVRDFIHVTEPFEVVAPKFVSDPTWLVRAGEAACGAAHDLVELTAAPPVPRGDGYLGSRAGSRAGFRAGFHAADYAPAHAADAQCRIGPARAHASSLLVPVWLAGAGNDAGVPELSGDLEVAPVGPARTLIAFGATYPRPGREATAVERVERATEAEVRTFLHGIAAALSWP